MASVAAELKMTSRAAAACARETAGLKRTNLDPPVIGGSKHRDFRIQVGFDERLTILQGHCAVYHTGSKRNLSEIETSTGGERAQVLSD